MTNGIKVLSWLIRNNQSLIPQDAIYPIYVPATAIIPAIAINSVNTIRRNTASQKETTFLYTERIQITIFDKKPDLLNDKIMCIINALQHITATINGVAVDSVLYENGGASGYEEDIECFFYQLDYIVKFRS